MNLIIIFAANSVVLSSASSEEVTLGNTQAPITLIEYGSLTCDNCIRFHRSVFPRLKKHYIDTGKVRFIYRHFPTSEAAVHGALAVDCAGEKSYEMLDELFLTTADWYQAEDKDRIFVKKATAFGLNTENYLSCISNKKQLDEIVSQRQAAKRELYVTGTPTFFINGKIVRGKRTFVEMKTLLGEALNDDNG